MDASGLWWEYGYMAVGSVYGVGIPRLRMFNLCIVITVANVYSLAYFFVYRYFQNCPL